MVDLIIFDLWQTLADKKIQVSDEIIRRTGVPLSKQQVIDIYEESLQLQQWKTAAAAYTNLCQNLCLPLTDQNISLLQQVFEESEQEITLYSFAIPLLNSLRQKGYKLGLLTNSSVFDIAAVRKKTPLFDFVDYTVFSYELGVLKPDPKIFLEMLQRAKCSPEKALMIGDKEKYDVAPARALGIYGIHFTGDYEKLKGDLYRFGVNVNST